MYRQDIKFASLKVNVWREVYVNISLTSRNYDTFNDNRDEIQPRKEIADKLRELAEKIENGENID